MPMNTGSTLAPQDEELLHLTFPGLLPGFHVLVVNPHLCVVSLLCLDSSEPSIRKQIVFTSSGMAVLVPLLQSYPTYCPYEVIISHLFPLLSIEDCRTMIQTAQGDERELLLRPLRRAVGNVSHGLYQLGLEACSLRNVGYILNKKFV
jgi:hypothetical protein